MTVPFMCKTADLQLGDVIQLFENGPFGSAIVTQIKDGEVHIFRPYGTSADFAYTGGVIPYIGTETVACALTVDREFKVWHRKELK